ncbi:tail completion protein gp17 [Paenibacillus donghaensis]|uniref:DUF3168 domain-containing protein n=1 Tax=Paenibacillus donghaensis TaxID=414771 RepID=A0A2Z2KVS8_9BACL|nr:DUF3168 domain-containing protein [Paenibacillus donghaensis]ASA25421.1 hypothetical protein B9T62_34630 [Paenibacillus donghaensis]
MIDLIPEVVSALRGRPELIDLLGGDYIWRHFVPEDYAEQFPRITFFEMINNDNRYAEDAADSSEIHFQVDVWHKAATAALGTEVDIAMKASGFARYSGADLFEEDTKIYHKALRYRTVRRYEED